MTDADLLRLWNGPTSQSNREKVLRFGRAVWEKARAEDDAMLDNLTSRLNKAQIDLELMRAGHEAEEKS